MKKKNNNKKGGQLGKMEKMWGGEKRESEEVDEGKIINRKTKEKRKEEERVNKCCKGRKGEK